MKKTGQHFFTSESVTEGHPDKVADQISDAVLDAIYSRDPHARVACETMVTTGLVLVSGEISTDCYVDIPKIARKKVLEIGYNDSNSGFDGETCAVLTSIDEQSPDIAQGVDRSLENRDGGGSGPRNELGAGDQGLMFGYAVDETSDLMPLPISLAHRLAKRLARVRKEGIISGLRPDGKTQVTIEYEGGCPKRVHTVVVSSQHEPDVELSELALQIEEHVIQAVIPGEMIDSRTKKLINPTGRFVTGGPRADCGLTGRKNIVDTYGGSSRNGGGALSGKDATKVDRSASYAARYVAKNVVAADLARRCELQVAYAIGVANPVSIQVNTFGTGQVPDEDIRNAVKSVFDLRPGAIIDELDLLRPIYQKLAAYGHFGRRDLDLPWERTDRISRLRETI